MKFVARPHSTVWGLPCEAGTSLCKMLGRLRYRHLALLVALDEYRNLHRAAKAAHLAQPSASKLVHDLELLFGSPLFDRLPTGMQPTEFGTVVLGFARRAMDELQRFAADLDNRRAGHDRRLTILTTMDVIPHFIVPAMAEIKQGRPNLAITLYGGTRTDIIDRLIDGHADMAIGYFTDTPQNNDINYEHLGTDALSIVARRDHPLSRETELGPQGLEQAAWVLHSLMNVPPGGMKTPANVVECSAISTVLSVLLSSDAVTMLPESLVREHVGLVRLPAAVGEIGLGILTRRGDAVSGVVREFVELLRERSDPGQHPIALSTSTGRYTIPARSHL